MATDIDKRDAMGTITRVLLSRNSGRETRRGAFTVLKQLVRLEPTTTVANVNSILDGLEQRVQNRQISTDDLTGIGQAIYFLSNKDAALGWDFAKRVIVLGSRVELGRAGWDKVAAVCSGTIRNGLDDPGMRHEITNTLVQLPNIVQAMVVRCARDQNDSGVFAQMSSLDPSPAARIELAQWAHERSRAIGAAMNTRAV